MPTQPTQRRPHEVELQMRRFERKTEDRKLDLLKAQLQAKVKAQAPQAVRAR